MQNPTLLNEQAASRLIGITRHELQHHTRQRTFGLVPQQRSRGECFYAPHTLQAFQRNLKAHRAAEALFR